MVFVEEEPMTPADLRERLAKSLLVVGLFVALPACQRDKPTPTERQQPAPSVTHPTATPSVVHTANQPTTAEAPKTVRRAIQVAVAADHTHIVMNDGTVLALGGNDFGALGLPKETKAVAVPTPIAGLAGVKQISTGTWHGCAAIEGGKAQCWGRNFGGALGRGLMKSDTFAEPANVVGLETVAEVGAAGNHSCARLLDGTAKCWGCVISGTVARPELLPKMTKLKSLALGPESSCALHDDQSVSCWDVVIGKEFDYGDAVTNGDGNVKKPAPVPGLAKLRSLSVSSTHACAVADDGTLYCWGHGSEGQLGTGSSGGIYRLLRPTAVPGITDAIQVSTGASYTCVVRREGKLSCFGQNGHGQLGLGDKRLRAKPEEVTSVHDVALVSAGEQHTCAMTTTGDIWCWGRNHRGQLGQASTGLTDARPSPMAVVLKGS
jgi:alpha-tubulin suppressor-like RCC1 family protein